MVDFTKHDKAYLLQCVGALTSWCEENIEDDIVVVDGKRLWPPMRTIRQGWRTCPTACLR